MRLRAICSIHSPYGWGWMPAIVTLRVLSSIMSARRKMEEVQAKELRNREDPLRMTDPFEDLFLEQRTEERCSLRGTGGKTLDATGERDQVLRATLVTVHPGEAAFEVTTRRCLHDLHHRLSSQQP